MNWYKRHILSQKVTKESQTYLDIGHLDYEGSYENRHPNILWILMGGSIATAEENDKTPTHNDAFPFIDLAQVYYGRYDPDTERLSLVRPTKGIREFKDIPMKLITLLDQKFNQPIISVF
jgi:hypothetical protein